eukprot:7657327-Pyramimonas_sp.AAC.1
MITLVVISYDKDGRRIREGGQKVIVTVDSKEGASIEATVRDNSDGTYSCTYVVPTRGDYTVHVKMNEINIQGSPFPVFFAAADPLATAPPTSASATSTGVTPE